MTQLIKFTDRTVTYDTFMNDLATRIAAKLKCEADDPEYISQRRAYAIFGRANVDRWRRNGKLQPRKRPGKFEYNMAQLRILQQTQQDYFTR